MVEETLKDFKSVYGEKREGGCHCQGGQSSHGSKLLIEEQSHGFDYNEDVLSLAWRKNVIL